MSDSHSGAFEYPDDPFEPNELVTNDAVAGEPVDPTGHYDGATGSEPLEASPEYDEHGDNSDDSPSEP
jgi:hypothetical protein